MSLELIGLALVMAATTYPSRALPLLVSGMDRLPGWALTYLRLVGPAVLAALAATAVTIKTAESGPPAFHIGIEWLAVALAVAVIAWRRNLFLGLLAAVVTGAVARATGLA